MKQRRQFISIVLIIAVGSLVYKHYMSMLLEEYEVEIKISPRFSFENVDDSESGRNYTMVYDVPPSTSSTIYMLFWGHYILEGSWGHAEETIDQEFLNRSKCPETDCVLTHKIDYLPNILSYDAVMINAFNEKMTMPKLRSPHQLYIMSTNE